MDLFDYHLSLAFSTFAALGTTFLTYGEQLAKTFLLLVTLVLVDFLEGKEAVLVWNGRMVSVRLRRFTLTLCNRREET